MEIKKWKKALENWRGAVKSCSLKIRLKVNTNLDKITRNGTKVRKK
jgi:hypothetical protein